MEYLGINRGRFIMQSDNTGLQEYDTLNNDEISVVIVDAIPCGFGLYVVELVTDTVSNYLPHKYKEKFDWKINNNSEDYCSCVFEPKSRGYYSKYYNNTNIK